MGSRYLTAGLTAGLTSYVTALVDLFYPERCPACDAWLPAGGAPGLCETCALSLYPLGAACPLCAEPQESPVALRCRRCRRDPPPFRRIVAPWRYGGELAVAIRRMKYGGAGGSGGQAVARGRPELVRPLAWMLQGALDAVVVEDEIDVVVPVPLHVRRLRDRGFSQAHELVRALGRIRPRLWNALMRDRPTEEQAGLSRAERLRNVAGAFSLEPRARGNVLRKRVLLVDDVVTTAATAAACTRALLAAGAASVTVIALARAEG